MHVNVHVRFGRGPLEKARTKRDLAGGLPYLSYRRERSRGGQMETRHPSRWLYALPPDLLAPAA